MNKAIVLGSRSEIARGVIAHLIDDGWEVDGWAKGDMLPLSRFDLVLVAMGTVAPVGLWHDINGAAWELGMEVNLLAPLRLLRMLWPQHNQNACVCFLAGSNPQMIMPGYSAYNVSKMAMLKLVEQLDAETPDARFFALGPGTILTKIHQATVAVGWKNPKLEAAMAAAPDKAAQIRRVYECLAWCLQQPKEAIGGRNICVSDAWESGFLGEWLRKHPNGYKLRRNEP